MSEPLRADSHYVPRLYLRAFAAGPEQIYAYRTLVSSENVPLWKACSTKAIVHRTHLYTRIAAGNETDEIEKWLEQDFETPAVTPLQTLIAGDRLVPDDWHHIVRFVAAQIVRTPAFFVANMPRWRKSADQLLSQTLRDGVAAFEEAKRVGIPLSQVPREGPPYSDLLPVRITTQKGDAATSSTVQAKLIVGRGMWLFSMKTALTQTIKELHKHRWTVLAPADGLSWFTSDDPVIRLNYQDERKYDFGGGWGSKGTELILPVSPRHLLYTKIGDERGPRRGEVLSVQQTKAMRRVIAEHAFRLIIAPSPVEDILSLRKRRVDKEAYRSEQTQWDNWHSEQTNAECRL